MIIEAPNNKNSTYIGDSVYIYRDSQDRIWLLTSNGLEIDNKICLDEVDIRTLVINLLARHETKDIYEKDS